MAVHLIAHENAPNTNGQNGCARVWIDDADTSNVLVQLYETKNGKSRITPATIPSGEILGLLPVEMLLEAAEAVRARR